MTELSLHIMDIIQNSIVANASLIELKICESIKADTLSIDIVDDGKGMDAETLRQVTDPFFTTRTTRKVGMGLSLFKQASELCGGSLEIASAPGKGTTVRVRMVYNHIDRQPLGDIAGVVTLLVSANPEIDFIYSHKTDAGEYTFSTKEVKDELGDVPLTNPKVINFIREMIQENLNAINFKN